MAAKSRERLTKWSRGHYLLNVFETSVAIIFTESSRGSFIYLNEYPACSSSNENFIGFKSKKTIELLSVKSILRYLGKPLVVPQST